MVVLYQILKQKGTIKKKKAKKEGEKWSNPIVLFEVNRK